ncbi:MAG: hypothetical protein CVU57_26555 [Deltaproteobacteria bacterium HGW-Deltaproteobacteria-15]|jgi:hypothetical protein|nr:MAG: hypothetical protein CVU57_26555 [Deltaproteobacteria bacterium HGW-Deltaproteobacteria-15]
MVEGDSLKLKACARDPAGDIREPKRPSEILSRWIKRCLVFQEIKTLKACNKQLTFQSVIPLTGNPGSTF